MHSGLPQLSSHGSRHTAIVPAIGAVLRGVTHRPATSLRLYHAMVEDSMAAQMPVKICNIIQQKVERGSRTVVQDTQPRNVHPSQGRAWRKEKEVPGVRAHVPDTRPSASPCPPGTQQWVQPSEE